MSIVPVPCSIKVILLRVLFICVIMPKVQQGFSITMFLSSPVLNTFGNVTVPSRSLGNVIFQWLWMPQVGLFSQLCPKDMEVCNAPHNFGYLGLRFGGRCLGKMGLDNPCILAIFGLGFTYNVPITHEPK